MLRSGSSNTRWSVQWSNNGLIARASLRQARNLRYAEGVGMKDLQGSGTVLRQNILGGRNPSGVCASVANRWRRSGKDAPQRFAGGQKASPAPGAGRRGFPLMYMRKG